MGKYDVVVDTHEYQVDVPAQGHPVITGRDTVTEVRQVSENLYSVIHGRQSYTVVAAKVNGSFQVTCGGVQHSVEVSTERGRLLKKYATTGGGKSKRTEVHAPMPAMVIRVEVAPGDEVKEGQGLVILEAMKMENEITAQHAGRIKSVLVEKGKAVEKGELMMLLE